MQVVDRKIYSKYYNDETFSSNLTDFNLNLAGNVMEVKKAVYTINVNVSFNQGNSNYIYIDSGLSRMGRQFGSFITDGFSIGDEFQATYTLGGTTYVFNATINSITATEIFYTKLSGTDGSGGGQTYSVVLVSPLTGLQLNYGLIENSEPTNYLSKLDNYSQGWYVENVGFDTGGGVRSTVFQNGQPLGFNINKSWVNGSVKARYVQNVSGHVQQYEVEHEFIIPYYLDGELTNIQTLTPPTDFNGSNSIKYVSQFEFRRVLTDPNSAKFVTDDNILGSVGYFNEPFNGLNNPFSISNLVYEDVTATVIPKIEAGADTTVKFTIDSTSASFIATSRLGLYASYLPEIDEYQDVTNKFETNFIYDSKFVDSGTPLVVVTPKVIKSVTSTFVSANQLDVEMVVNFSDSRIDDTKHYVIGVEVASDLGSNQTSDKTLIKIDSQNFEKSTDIPDLYELTKLNFELYPDAKGTKSNTNLDVWVEDSINVDFDFNLDKTKNAVLNELDLFISAYNPVTEQRFDLEKVSFDLTSQVIVSGSQVFNINQQKGFNFGTQNDYNQIVLSTGFISPTIQTYTGNVSIKIDWQDWLSLAGADTVFYDNTKQNNGLNENSSNYSLKSGYEIRVFIDAVVEESTSTIETLYSSSSPQNRVFNYDLDDQVTPTYSGVIETFDTTGVNLSGAILQNADTELKATWSTTGSLSPITAYFGTISLEPINSSSKNAIKIYDASLAIVGANLEATYLLPVTEIQQGVTYKISARIKCEEVVNPPVAKLTSVLTSNQFGIVTFNGVFDLKDYLGGSLSAGDEVSLSITTATSSTFIGSATYNYASDLFSGTTLTADVGFNTYIKPFLTGNLQDGAIYTFDKYEAVSAWNLANGTLAGANLGEDWVVTITAKDVSENSTSTNTDNTASFTKQLQAQTASLFIGRIGSDENCRGVGFYISIPNQGLVWTNDLTFAVDGVSQPDLSLTSYTNSNGRALYLMPDFDTNLRDYYCEGNATNFPDFQLPPLKSEKLTQMATAFNYGGQFTGVDVYNAVSQTQLDLRLNYNTRDSANQAESFEIWVGDNPGDDPLTGTRIVNVVNPSDAITFAETVSFSNGEGIYKLRSRNLDLGLESAYSYNEVLIFSI